MRGKQTAGPYKPLGQKLRALRTHARESLADASGAVEIDVAQLANYESGYDRPTEEVLLLLISHFDAQDVDALHLWKLAGYGLRDSELLEASNDDEVASFTDFVEVSANPAGLIVEFKQSSLSGAPKSLAKLGMSREQAQHVIQALMVALANTSGRGKLILPSSSDKSEQR